VRCRACHRTGFTEAELVAHEKKTGHRNADKADRSSGREFTDQVARIRFDKAELLAALAELGVQITGGKIVSVAGEPVEDEPATEDSDASKGGV